MLIIAAIILLLIYIACPLVVKIVLLIANSIVPDPVLFIDEFIMWIGLFLHFIRLMLIAEFVYMRKKHNVILLSICGIHRIYHSKLN